MQNLTHTVVYESRVWNMKPLGYYYLNIFLLRWNGGAAKQLFTGPNASTPIKNKIKCNNLVVHDSLLILRGQEFEFIRWGFKKIKKTIKNKKKHYIVFNW